jgi:multiple sugar transport system substrate-binding protein
MSNEYDRKGFIAGTARSFAERRIGKREFLRRLGLAGVGLSSFGATMLGGNRRFPALAAAQALDQTGPSPDMTNWLRDVGGQFKGTKIRFVSEATPPTLVAQLLARDEFTANTGIEVDIEIVPLERVLQRVTGDVQAKAGAYDLFYLDQSWTSLFVGDTVDPRELYERKPELALPDFDWSDFSKPLRHPDLHPHVPQGSVREAQAQSADDDGRVHVGGEGARCCRARQWHLRHHRPT